MIDGLLEEPAAGNPAAGNDAALATPGAPEDGGGGGGGLLWFFFFWLPLLSVLAYVGWFYRKNKTLPWGLGKKAADRSSMMANQHFPSELSTPYLNPAAA